MKKEKHEAGYYSRTGTGKKTEKDPVTPSTSPLVSGPKPSVDAKFPKGLNTND